MKSFIAAIILTFLCCELSSQGMLLAYQNDTVLNNYLITIMHKQYAGRKKNLKHALKSVENIKEYQDKCIQRYKNLLRNFPVSYKDSLPAVVSSGNYLASPAWNYTIEKIILNKHITANLYSPKKEGKKPAILLFCGHEISGKATESYQKTAILLAQYGFVVMAIDPIGQGERIQLIDSTGTPLTARATTEHTLLNMGAMLTGWSIAEEELMDNVLCMNYLCSLSEVDKNNIGCIGNSGGGTQATYFSALDTRIKAVACCSWFTKRERMFEHYGPDDGCQYLANEGREQLEIADYYIMQAPRPTLILAGKKDVVDYQGTEEAFKEVAAVYKKLNATNNATLFSVDDGHGISQPKREEAVRFFINHLMNDTITVKEDSIEVVSERELQCTSSGQICIDYPEEDNLQTYLLKRAENYDYDRSYFIMNNLDSNRVKIKQLLGIPEKLNAIKAKSVGNERKQNLYSEKAFILKRKKEPEISVRMLTPNTGITDESQVFIIMSDNGMQYSIHLPVVEKIIRNGNIVILSDPRGIGETKDSINKNNKKYYSDDYRNASLSLFVGKPLLGQRVIDMLTILDFISNEETLKRKTINCFGFGNIGVVTRIVSYLDNRISHTATKDGIISWLDILQYPTEKNRMSVIVPNVLMYFDIKNLRKPLMR